jgi:hypothetical protein
MKHSYRNDFDAAVTKAGVTVTFKPTNNMYSFYRFADGDDVARLAPVALGRGGASGDTEDYPPGEVQEMAQRIALEVAAVWPVQDEEDADRLTTVSRPQFVGDGGD